MQQDDDTMMFASLCWTKRVARTLLPRMCAIVTLGILLCCVRTVSAAEGAAGEGEARDGDQGGAAPRVFRAGAAAIDISPPHLPVIVNGGFFPVTATKVNDPLHARAIVLDDGQTLLAICVVDSCVIPREMTETIKARASQATGIAADRILISATHTHSAPSLMRAHASEIDPHYPDFLAVQIVSALARAKQNLAPAEVGWTTVDDPAHTNCRQWIFRPDKIGIDPFGEQTVRANMHPGHQNPDCVGPEGPVDPALSLLSLRTLEGRPIALLANYSMHYYGAAAVSADYFGFFAAKMQRLLGGESGDAPVVGIMSQGTSGDLMWPDYGAPKQDPGLQAYADSVAEVAHRAYQTIQYQRWVPLAMREREMHLHMRVPNEKRLAWARETLKKLDGATPRTLGDIYAGEQIYLHEHPERDIKLQAIRVGELGILAIPCEVFGITGLKLKAQSPLATNFVIELANGEDGYIPPPELHKLGGYTTWACRTAGLEEQAEPKIVDALLEMLEQVAERPRRPIVETHGEYARGVLADQPAAYWRLNHIAGTRAVDAGSGGRHGTLEDGVVYYLEGPEAPSFSGEQTNRAVHFAGGRLRADVPDLGQAYSVELWFWNGLPNDARPVTGYLWSRGADGAAEADGDHLGIGGTHEGNAGKLIFFNGNRANRVLAGTTTIAPKSWNHVVLVRDGKQVEVYLNGNPQAEISGEIESTFPAGDPSVFVGGRNDRFANFEGKIDEVAVYARALKAADAVRHFATAKLPGSGPQPTAADQSIGLMQLAEGFEIELVAAEPLVQDPVAIQWGADGKLWVAEMADYPLGIDGKMTPCGRIRYLEDSDGDGRYDRSTLFMTGVNFPNGILPWKKGVLVTAAPEIFYAEDTDGDGRADVRKTLFDGFVPGNPQLRVNGLQWGLDGWVYCANGWSGGVVRSTATGATADIRGRDLRVDPDTGALDPLSGVTEFGRNRDDWGNWFGCDNSHPLWQFMLEDHYTRRNPFFAPPDARQQLLVPVNPRVFALSVPAKRYHSFEHADRYTSACAAMVYRDDLLFERGGAQHAFVCEPVHNMVHHAVLTPSGASFQASRAPGEEASEFLASTDPWFRPVFVSTGPDGALWVVDMYRYMIEHPGFLPPEGQAELAPYFRLGEDRGRIYRIVPRGKRPRPMQTLAGRTPDQLVAALDSSNGWQRDTAQQQLIWSQDKSAVPALSQMARQSKNPLARLQALATLACLDGLPDLQALSSETLQHALGDPHPALRRWGARLAETRFEQAPELVKPVVDLAADSDAGVRLQVACTLGQTQNALAAPSLAELLRGAVDDPMLTAAAMSSVNKANVQAVLMASLAKGGQANGSSATETLVALAVSFDNLPAVNAALGSVLGLAEQPASAGELRLVARVLEALAARGQTLDALAQADSQGPQRVAKIHSRIKQAQQIVGNEQNESDLRAVAIRLLGYDEAAREADIELLAGLLAPRVPGEVQGAAVLRLARLKEPAVADRMLAAWGGLGPALRGQVLTALVSRPPWAMALLEQVAAHRVAPQELDAATRQRLTEHADKSLAERARQLLVVSAADRQQVMESLDRVLALPADAERGAGVFRQRCASCHRLGDVGFEVGPNLAALTDKAARSLLSAILDPNAAVEARYRNYVVVTTDGRTANGILAAETGNSITLLGQEAKQQTILRQDVDELRASEKSLMPEGLEKDLPPQALADVVAFVRSAIAPSR